MAVWNPDQYLKFANERTQAAIDLLNRLGACEPASVLDLGCGPGNSTAIVRARYPKARVVGLDSSSEMIDRAQRDFPQGEWLLADASVWSAPEPYDVVFSNAALQWIPDHEALMPRLLASLKPGGLLAFQVPGNFGSPLHKSLLKVAADGSWRDALAGLERLITYRSLPFYYDLLCQHASRIDLWETTYFHRLASKSAIIEWYRPTGMRPFLERLAESERAGFEDRVLRGCQDEYAVSRDGSVLFPFRRLFCVAEKR